MVWEEDAVIAQGRTSHTLLLSLVDEELMWQRRRLGREEEEVSGIEEEEEVSGHCHHHFHKGTSLLKLLKETSYYLHSSLLYSNEFYLRSITLYISKVIGIAQGLA